LLPDKAKLNRDFLLSPNKGAAIKQVSVPNMSIDPTRPKPDPEMISGNHSKPADHTNELDLWDLDSRDSNFTPPSVMGETPVSEPQFEPIPERAESLQEVQAVGKTTEKEYDEYAGKANQTDNEAMDRKPSSIPAGLKSLSIIEKIAICGLFAILAIGGLLTYIHYVSRVPTRPLMAEEIDYPVSGKIIEIKDATTYWRKPILTGEAPDVVKHGTQIIPVIKLSIQSKSGAIRIFFRNYEGKVIGDAITRTVKGAAELTIPATAGFDDIGMHTAYRTEQDKRWVVEILEASDETASGDQFHRILEMDILPQTR
jgi:hypothetical protein